MRNFKHMKQILLSLLFVCSFALFGNAQTRTLHKNAEISLLTCDVGNEVYAMYGHSAIRVHDATQGIDWVFNYGLFSFSQPHFVYRFAQGRTDYLLGAQSYASFYSSYKHSRRSVSEQKLNLSLAEKQKLFDFLLWNVQPENATYRYDFLYDNCATRVRDAIENCVDGEIIYGDKIGTLHTFRDLVNHYQQVSPWTNFGIHLLLGSPTDIAAEVHDQMFLPPYLETQYAQTKVKRGNEISNLCEPVHIIYQAPATPTLSPLRLHLPSLVFALVLLFYVLLTMKQWKYSTIKYTADYFWLILNGLIGLILVWFFFFSELPAMRANYNLLWAGALNFPFAFIWMKKSWRTKLVGKYWFIPALMSCGFLLSAPFLPQSFPLPIYLFVLISALRSVFVCYKIQQ